MIGIIVALGVAALTGTREREAFKKHRRCTLVRASTIVFGFSVFGGFVDIACGTWPALGVSVATDMQSFSMYLLGYIVPAMYAMLAAYYGRVVPITLRAVR
ncbi:MAG: hypothetical protein Athens041674_483 [Parcubacteria group bacterium Athens0416_74]|nr:MAG: hypothetical protein Athens041674_483 [Parcubacteria group bacterium Athens0416_74]